MIKVFYDGKCGLCSKEINHYRKIAGAGIFFGMTSRNLVMTSIRRVFR